MTSIQQDDDQQRDPKFSVLAAAWNEADNIEAFITSFLDLSYPNKELILCAGGVDDTFERATGYAHPEVTLLRQEPGEGKQRALRKGYRHVTGDIVVLTDADCVLNNQSIDALVEPILNEGENVTTGTSKPKRTQLNEPFVAYQYASHMLRIVEGKHATYIRALLGRNCAIRKAALDHVDAFDEDVPTGTDSFLAKKLVEAGYKIRFVPESAVETDYTSKLGAYFSQQTRWLRNGVVRNWQFRSYRRTLRALIPIGVAVTMLLLPLMAFFTPLALVLWLILFGTMAQTRIKALRCLAAVNEQTRVQRSAYLRLPFYMIVEWITRAAVLFRLSTPRW